jgi:hypothetical protein
MGQLTHAGKRAVFGLGRYRLVEPRPSPVKGHILTKFLEKVEKGLENDFTKY